MLDVYTKQAERKRKDGRKERMRLVGMREGAAEDWFRWRQMWGAMKGSFIAKSIIAKIDNLSIANV